MVSFSFSQAMEIPPTPAPAANESSRVVAETTAVIGADESLACTVELFTRDYDASQGNLTSTTPRGTRTRARRAPVFARRATLFMELHDERRVGRRRARRNETTMRSAQGNSPRAASRPSPTSLPASMEDGRRTTSMTGGRRRDDARA